MDSKAYVVADLCAGVFAKAFCRIEREIYRTESIKVFYGIF